MWVSVIFILFWIGGKYDDGGKRIIDLRDHQKHKPRDDNLFKKGGDFTFHVFNGNKDEVEEFQGI